MKISTIFIHMVSPFSKIGPMIFPTIFKYHVFHISYTWMSFQIILFKIEVSWLLSGVLFVFGKAKISRRLKFLDRLFCFIVAHPVHFILILVLFHCHRSESVPFWGHAWLWSLKLRTKLSGFRFPVEQPALR